MRGKFDFAIDRGGTFTDVVCICPDGKVKTLKLLSVDPDRYSDAPREGIRRILAEVKFKSSVSRMSNNGSFVSTRRKLPIR